MQFPEAQEKGQREVDRVVGYGNIRQFICRYPLISSKKPGFHCCSHFRRLHWSYLCPSHGTGNDEVATDHILW